jgi:class 3 adenylate cyclase
MRAEEHTSQRGGQTIRAVLFTDIEGSAALRSRHGDLVADQVDALHERIVRGQIERHGALDIALLGGGLLASFDTALDAVAAAVSIEREIAALREADPDRALRVRIGVHAGPMSATDGTLHGQTVDAASRVTLAAAGGQILVSSAVRDAARRAESSWHSLTGVCSGSRASRSDGGCTRSSGGPPPPERAGGHGSLTRATGHRLIVERWPGTCVHDVPRHHKG